MPTHLIVIKRGDNMFELSNIYKVTKQIDEQFALHYGNDEEIVRKNIRRIYRLFIHGSIFF